MTHHRVQGADYNTLSAGFVRNVLKAFPVQRTRTWLDDLGVALKQEPTGKLFPVTDKARTVLHALLGRLDVLGATRQQSFDVVAVRRVHRGDEPPKFEVESAAGSVLAADRVILCTGGRSVPGSGSDGRGYRLAEALGHTVTRQHPALVSMVLHQHWFHAELAGQSHAAELVTVAEGQRKPRDRRSGSLLWTHFGLSGPLVMDASRHHLAVTEAGGTPRWRLSVVPGCTAEQIDTALQGRCGSRPRETLLAACEAVVRAVVPEAPAPRRVLELLLGAAGLNGGVTLAQLPRAQRRDTAATLTATLLPVEQHRGWNHAEVTAGGVPLSEVSWRTMESRVCPGLHLAGEILDLDGRIGGFNFQWAWATGYLAGTAAALGVGAAARV